MQKFQCLTAAIGLTALSISPAHAMGSGRFKGEALLAEPTATVVEAKVAGVKWTCVDRVCIGVGPAYSGLDDLQKECGKLAAAVGPLAGFKSRGRIVVGDKLEICNRLAGQDPAEYAAR